MRQIKEKSTGTAATVNGANHENQVHIEDTIKNLIRHVDPVNFKLEDVGLSMMCYTLGKE